MFSSPYTSHMYINSNNLRALSLLLVTGILIYFERWDSHPSNDIKSNESNSPYPWILKMWITLVCTKQWCQWYTKGSNLIWSFSHKVIDQLIKIMKLKSITWLAYLYRKHNLHNRTTFVYYSTTQSFSCQYKIYDLMLLFHMEFNNNYLVPYQVKFKSKHLLLCQWNNLFHSRHKLTSLIVNVPLL